MAVRAVELASLDLAVLFETKIPDTVYMKHFRVCAVVCSPSLPHQGGAALVTKSNPDGWHVEDTRFHGPNVLSCVIVSGPQQMPLIGAYLPPSSLDLLCLLESALQLCAALDSVDKIPILIGRHEQDTAVRINEER